MGDYDYKDPDFGFFDDVIELASFSYDAWIKTGAVIDDDGIKRDRFKKTTIRGSLQVYSQSMDYPTTGGDVVTSSRDGRFFARYTVKLNEGDLIRKGSEFFKVTTSNDYDYAGVRNYNVVRLGLAEVREYSFFDTLENSFE